MLSSGSRGYCSHPVFLRIAPVAASICPFFFSFCLTFQLLCTIEDLKEMGIPLGPRKKIAKFVKERVSMQVWVSAGVLFVSERLDHDSLVFRCDVPRLPVSQRRRVKLK